MKERVATYCPTCLTLTRSGDEFCTNCSAPRPEESWPSVRSNRYPWLGQVVDGRYEFVQYIGFGSTGEVYRVRSRSTGRSFAAKVIERERLPRRVDFEELSNRLRREVLVLGAVRSPHVVSVIDFILGRDGDLFVIIMDLAQGTTLERMIYEQHRIPVFRALEMTEQLLEALSDVHERGVVHRDLKPENIVVRTQRSGRPFVLLLDFGIAKVDDDASMTHGFVGTPLFSSPEQIRNAELVDERSDLYSVGCILFNMLTGRPPFFAERGSEVMRMHLTLPPPSMKVHTGNAPLDRELEAFVARALAKEPDERFGTAMEMLAAPVFDLGKTFGLFPPDLDDVLPEQQRSNAITASSTAVGEEAEDVSSTQATEPPQAAAGEGEAAPSPLPEIRAAALSASLDWAATLDATGRLAAWDTVRGECTVETHLTPTDAMGARLVWLDATTGIAVLEESGALQLLNPRTLKQMLFRQVEPGPYLWAGRSVESGVVLVLRPDALEVLHVRDGGEQRIALPATIREVPIVCRHSWGHVFYLFEQRLELHVREAGGAFSVRATPMSVRLQGDARPHDVLPGGRLLVSQGGGVMAVESDGSGIQILNRAVQGEWEAAQWVSNDAFVALNTGGDLMWMRSNDPPVTIAEGARFMLLGDDRSHVMYVDESNRVRIWRRSPGSTGRVPAVSTTTRAPAASEPGRRAPRREECPWDLDPEGPRVVCVRQGKVLQADASGWKTLRTGVGAVSSVVLSNDGQATAWLGANNTLHVIREGKPPLSLPLPDLGRLRSVALFDGGDGAVLADEEGVLTAIRLPRRRNASMEVLWTRPVDQRVCALRGSALASTLLVALADGAILLMSIQNGTIRTTVQPGRGPARDAGFSFDGHMVVALRGEREVEVYDCHAGRLAYRTDAPRPAAERVALLQDGSLLYGMSTGTGFEVRRVEDDALMGAFAFEGAPDGG